MSRYESPESTAIEPKTSGLREARCQAPIHLPENVVAESGQINVKLRPIIGAGQWQVTVSHRGSTSLAFEINVAGTPPPIKGLDSLQY